MLKRSIKWWLLYVWDILRKYLKKYRECLLKLTLSEVLSNDAELIRQLLDKEEVFFQSTEFKNSSIDFLMREHLSKKNGESLYSHSKKVYENYFKLNLDKNSGPIQSLLTRAQLKFFLFFHDIGKLIDHSLHSYHSYKIIRDSFKELFVLEDLFLICQNHLLFGFIYENIFRYTPLIELRNIKKLNHFQSYLNLNTQDLIALCGSKNTLEFLLFHFAPADISAAKIDFDYEDYYFFAKQIWGQVTKVSEPKIGEYLIEPDPDTFFLLPFRITPGLDLAKEGTYHVSLCNDEVLVFSLKKGTIDSCQILDANFEYLINKLTDYIAYLKRCHEKNTAISFYNPCYL